MKIKREKEWNAGWALHHRSNKVELDDCLGTTRRVRCTLLHSDWFCKTLSGIYKAIQGYLR